MVAAWGDNRADLCTPSEEEDCVVAGWEGSGNLYDVNFQKKCIHSKKIKDNESYYIPLVKSGEKIGFIYLVTDKEVHSDREDARQALEDNKRYFINAVSNNIALSIANMKLQKSLLQQSIKDPLTGVYNRRYMEESLIREPSRAEGIKNELTVLMLDVDHFKSFNDSYGHPKGDLLLVKLADLLNGSMRHSDIICWYGGDEFILIFPDIK